VEGSATRNRVPTAHPEAALDLRCERADRARCGKIEDAVEHGRRRAGHRVHFERGAGQTGDGSGDAGGAGREMQEGRNMDQSDTLDAHATVETILMD
jgi:hypothetical protein